MVIDYFKIYLKGKTVLFALDSIPHIKMPHYVCLTSPS